MRRKWLSLAIPLAALVLVFGAGCGGDDEGGEGGDTLVFATEGDPIALDGALVSDGPSLTAVAQIFETLITLKPGGTELEPALAESWEVSPDATSVTLNLRQGVTFHDGTEFNADAVCTNFSRWYNFKGAFQNLGATYYWQTVFGGFSDKKAPSLFRSCEAVDQSTVRLTLTKPSASVLGALTLPSFSIASPQALEQYEADKGTVDDEGTFRPTGTFATEHPIGTGAFKFESWNRDDQLVMVRNDEYWGEKALLERLIFKPIADNAARLQALQTGEVQGYEGVEPQDIKTIEGDDGLQVIDRPAFNVGYIGINQAKAPMDKLEVRQAVAHALNREAVVTSFYAGRGEVANQFMPPSLEGYAQDGVKEYAYDPERAKQLLDQAGLSTPVEIEFAYPSEVSRPYMPDPKRNFEAFRADLEKAGFKVTPKTALWDTGAYGDALENGKYQLYLYGWTGDFGDPDNFIGTFFQTPQPAWGFENEEIFRALDQAEQESDEAKRIQMYEDANRLIMEFLPGVPYVHTEPGVAFRADVQGYQTSPTSLEFFKTVSIGESE